MLDMDQSAIGWVQNTASRNFWRVSDFCDFEDLVQDGMMVFCRVAKKYPDRDTPKKLMPAFKIAFVNHIHTMSCKRTAKWAIRDEFAMLEASEIEPAEQGYDEPRMLELLMDAPPDVRRVLEFCLTEEKSKALSSPHRFRRDSTRETTHEKMCLALGIDPNSDDILARVHSYLVHEKPVMKEPEQAMVREKFVRKRERFIRRREKFVPKVMRGTHEPSESLWRKLC